MSERQTWKLLGRGALAGIVWRAAEPTLQRVFGHPYSDPQLATAFVPGRTAALDYAVQATGGAAFAWAFRRLGGRSAIPAVLAENALLLAASPLVDRIHPYVRDGRWPPLTGNPRAAAVSVSGHLLYAVLLDTLLP